MVSATACLKTGVDIRNEQALWEYAKAEPEHLNMLCYLAHYIENILEDGYIESRVLTRFTGRLGICLDILRERQWAEGLTLTQLKEYEEDGGHIAMSVLQSILSYVKFGQIKYGDEPLSDERIQAVLSSFLSWTVRSRTPQRKTDGVSQIKSWFDAGLTGKTT